VRLASTERERQATAVKLALGATRARLLQESAAAILFSAAVAVATAVVLSRWLLTMGRYLSRHALLEAELSLDLSVMVLGVVAAVGISCARGSVLRLAYVQYRYGDEHVS